MDNLKRYGGVVVKCGDEVLMCKRNKTGTLPGVYSIPAGHLHKDEHPLKGAKREFKEETDIDIDDDIHLCGFINRTTKDGKHNKGLMYVFLWEVDDKVYPDLENAKDGNEHTSCRYFKKDEIPKYGEKDQLNKLLKNILS